MSMGCGSIAAQGGGDSVGPSSVAMGGDVTGVSSAAVVVAAQGNPFDAVTLGAGDAGKGMQWDGAKWVAVSSMAVQPTGVLAALTPANRFLARTSAGLVLHDGSESRAAALLSGGMCVTGGAAASSQSYYTTGPAPVGVTGWTPDVPLYPNAVGGMVPRGDATLTGLFSRECGVYDGSNFSVAIGPVEAF